MNDLLLLSKLTVIIKPFIIMGKVRRAGPGQVGQVARRVHTHSAGALGKFNFYSAYLMQQKRASPTCKQGGLTNII